MIIIYLEPLLNTKSIYCFMRKTKKKKKHRNFAQAI